MCDVQERNTQKLVIMEPTYVVDYILAPFQFLAVLCAVGSLVYMMLCGISKVIKKDDEYKRKKDKSIRNAFITFVVFALIYVAVKTWYILNTY